MAETGDFFGAYPEGCPSNDPRERGDAGDVESHGAGYVFPAGSDADAADGVNRDGFDPKYTS